jgi:flagellar hook-length control protein FliK
MRCSQGAAEDMAAVETLPIAQPAARPETAAARKPVSAPNETDRASFADMVDAEVDVKGARDARDAKTDSDGGAETARADLAAVSAQPIPATPTPVVNVQATAVLAALQAAVASQVESPIEATKTTVSQPAATPAAAPAAVAPAVSLDPVIATTTAPDAAQPVAPASPETAIPVAVTSIANAEIPAAPAVETAASTAAAAISVTALAAPKAASPATKDKAPQESSSASDDASTGDAPEAPAPTTTNAAPTAPVNTQAAALAQAAAPTLSAPKPAASATASEASPGSRRAANRADAPAPAATGAAATSATPAKPASSGVTPVATATAQANAQVQASAASADATPDIKPDAPAASSTASTSFADALSAARAQASDAGRTQSVSPQLQSAPAATVQVYTKFVERFDGRAQRFEVRLDPAELGRVDIRIEIGADKKVHAVLAAHDSAALSDLMRGQRSLERALNDAGIDLAEGGLRFELSDNSGRNLAGGQQRGETGSDDQLAHAWRAFSTVDIAADAETAQAATAWPYSWRASRLDLVA